MANTTVFLLIVIVFAQGMLGQLDLPPKDPVDEVPEDDVGDNNVVEYVLPDGLEPNDNGYGGQPELKCRMEEKVSYEDVCEPYVEEMCYTQNVEECEDKPYNNCTGSVEVETDRVCFNVEELLCSLEQKTDYEAVQEKYQVQKCTTLLDRVCDTNYNLDVVTEDDYQCIDLEDQYCEDVEVMVNDVVCKYSFKFECKKPKRGTGGYGMEKVCTKEPEEKCYETPRMIRKSVCKPRPNKYCEKFSNTRLRPVEVQNCHFEKRNQCELEDKLRPRKAKRYSYHKECKKVPREVCDMVERKKVVPNCVTEFRPKCTFLPVEKCDKMEKQYCYKEEKVTMEEVCERKLAVEFL